MTGRHLLHYEILDKLGEGGMGVVYKARDTHLDRFVAIKVLPAEFCHDPSRLLRFEREARAAAALNHSGIAAVYDTGQHDGVPYIVSEFVEGRTLRALLREGPLPHRRAVEIAAQLAEALSVAHVAGIVHRDLKPENVIVTRESHVKILDFGLARQIAPHRSSDQTAALTLTQQGTVVGTPGYMSPEQVRGEPPGPCSDIFSLGLMLHEMLSGLRTFDRPTMAETMAAIVRDDPQPLPASVPPGLSAIAAHCLEKEPANRFQSAHDLAFDLRSVTGSSPAIIPSKPTPRLRRVLRVVAGTSAVALAGLFAGVWLAGPEIDVTKHRYTPIAVAAATRAISEGGGAGGHLAAWSPDAKSIVYSADGLRLQRLDSSESVRLTKEGMLPFFFADGSRIYFLATGKSVRELWSVSAAGGAPELVLPDLGGFGPLLGGVATSPDGKALAVVRPLDAGGDEMSVWVSSPPGAPPQPYPGSPTGRNLSRAYLSFSPDGKKLLVTLAPTGRPLDWWILSWPPPSEVRPGAVRRLFPDGPHGSYATSADWLSDSRHLIVALMEEGELSGPLWVADTFKGTWQPITVGPLGFILPKVSREGRILLILPKVEEHALEIPLDGSPLRPLLAGLRKEQYPSWSPVADQVLYVTDQRGDSEIWLASRKEGWQRPIVTQRDFPPEQGRRQFVSPAFSPDGTRIAYTTKGAVWVSPVSGGSPIRICDGYCPTWSPDGTWLAFVNNPRSKSTVLMKVPVGHPQDSVTLCSATARWLPRWSPDGQWITAQLPGGFGVISPDGTRTKVLYKGALDWGSACGWSRDGSTLYLAYLTAQGRVLSAFDIKTGTEQRTRDLGLLHFSYLAYHSVGLSPSPDGKSLAASTLNIRFEPWILDGLEPPRSLWTRLFHH